MTPLKKIADIFIKNVASNISDLLPSRVFAVLAEQREYPYKELPKEFNASQSTKSFFLNLIQNIHILPARGVLVYKNASVDANGVVFNNFRIAVPSLSHASKKIHYQDTFLLKQWVGKTIHFPLQQSTSLENALAVVYDSNAAGNYYHWLVEACSRIVLLRHKYPNCVLLVPSPVPEYVAVTARILGYDKLFEIGKEQIVKASHVLLAERTGEQTYYSNAWQDIDLIKTVQSELFHGLNIKLKKPFRLIYVSRARQKSRRVSNENEVIQLLKSQGFDILFFEDFSFEQQVKLMSETAVLIGAHGANLTNMLFMQPAQAVVELAQESNFNAVYYGLSSNLDLLYYRISCKFISENADANADIIVNMNDLKLTVAKALNEG